MAPRTLLLIPCFLAALACAASADLGADSDLYTAGVGIRDVTGPAAKVVMMGYAKSDQTTQGIHIRQRARAYVIQDQAGKRFVFVSCDLGMTFQSVKMGVVKKLAALYPGVYDHDNVMISSIHTHSGPGAFSWYILYSISTFGFSDQNYGVIVDGIVGAIQDAHNNMVPNVRMLINEGDVKGANINRSPASYLKNPAEERAKYSQDTESLMTLVRLQTTDGKDLGMINWFSVHCVSMTNENHLISSDNKGYASLVFEKEVNGPKVRPGKGPFIASFAQTNEGDSSPNTAGPSCPDGSPCAPDSTCNGKNAGCKGKGPGKDDFESTKIIGQKQVDVALDLFKNAKESVSGGIKFVHKWLDMRGLKVDKKWTPNGQGGATCPPAMGYAFAAGTTDGPGEFDFKQGDKTGNMFWNTVSSILKKPTKAQKECHSPKPILLDVGEISMLAWAPNIVPIQIARIGQLVLLAVPGEFTTMSGRRLRDAVKTALIAEGAADDNTKVVIAGLSNTYSGYITTYEEYQNQRYEGGSTLFGPHTLSAYIQEFVGLATDMAKDRKPEPGQLPKDLSGKTLSFIPPVVADTCPFTKSFGDVVVKPAASYKVGETVSVTFQAGDPRNNLMTEHTFLEVERLVDGKDQWEVILNDGDWETKFHWKTKDVFQSHALIEWEIAAGTPAGQYRIRHMGFRKFGALPVKLPYKGVSKPFAVVA